MNARRDFLRSSMTTEPQLSHFRLIYHENSNFLDWNACNLWAIFLGNISLAALWVRKDTESNAHGDEVENWKLYVVSDVRIGD